ncbi:MULTISPECIES: TolC family protein [Cupriavidus]|uniref:Outer membrane silver efflux protein n=1 Tax=Cupriavidus taiwanensis TaxID=164546 RepID=A0A7Z7NQG6_9BURK|nr:MULTISPECIES: TolC family protein [Cupriavidus]NOV26647.1 TolC family protein [Cupriavidus necator]NSX13229.1 TolC family protein [Cupriavidus taiwanensis]SOZ18855.1 Outer membrane silver efflux protein [Cupriavidus taiwanensis]SOZ96969.1 Outer membrane silver efflux protein [Cupriavidus taiwanensis]SPC25952.1 Outer membrane silver efflux protein [Cupriavidus taiwanensis]
MHLRSPFAYGCRLTLALTLLAAAHPGWAQPAAALSLQEAVALASSGSSDAETSRSAVQSAIEMAVVGRQLPDPVLKVGVNNVPANGPDRFSLGTESMTMRSISLMQEFTRSAKREARAQRFEAEASSAEAQRTAALAMVQRGAATAWLDRWYAERAYTVLSEQAHSIQLMVDAAQAAYRGNRGSRADIVAAELELQQLQDREDEARAALASARAMLRRWVGQAAERPLTERPALEAPAWLNTLEADGVAQLPDVAAAEAQVGVAEAESRVARENKIPDVSVELMYSQRGPAYSNMVSLNVSLPLPWDQKHRQDRELAAKLAQADAARAQAEVIRRGLIGQLRGKQAELSLSQARLERYRNTTVPLAKAQTEAALTAYRAGAGTLTAVADASRKALNISLERLKLEAATARLWADLAFLMPLPTAAHPTSLQGTQP